MRRWIALLVFASLITRLSAHEPIGVPVPVDSSVKVLTDTDEALVGTTVHTSAPGWMGLSTSSGTVFIPLSSIEQVWLVPSPAKTQPPIQPVPDARYTRMRALAAAVDDATVPSDATGNIYERLWQLDQMRNGLSASSRNPDGTWVDPDADILLDEQAPSRGGDQAPNKLFFQVKPDKLTRPTYVTVKPLLDNYVAKDGLPEDDIGGSDVEDAEIEAFLDAVLATDVMDLCKGDIEQRVIQRTLPDDEFRATIRKQWFKLYDNFYRRPCDSDDVPNPKKFINGFEHVFVGDYSGNRGIGGHHFWYKFHLDEEAGNAATRGYVYDTGSGGERYPWVATFAMNWTIDGKTRTDGIKGFSVGNSPELLIAWGTMAEYETAAGLRMSDRIPVTIEGGRLNLVVYLETLPNCNRGDQIRSLYPEFMTLNGAGGGGGGSGGGGTQVMPQTGPIVISRAMINPSGDEAGNEWVELKNVGDAGAIDLGGWSLCDRLDRCQSITGSLSPGETTIIVCTRATPAHPQLSNRNATITIRNADGEVATQVGYTSTTDGVPNVFDLP